MSEEDRPSVTKVVNRRALTMVVLALPLITGAATAGLSAGWLGPGGAGVRPDEAAPSIPVTPRPADTLTPEPRTEPSESPADSPSDSPARAPQQPREAPGRSSGGAADPAAGEPATGGGTGAPAGDGRVRDDRDQADRGRTDRDRDGDHRDRDDRGRDHRDRDGRGPDHHGRNGPYHTDGTFGRSY